MCDTVCVRRSGGKLFAKSSDRPIDEAQVLRWFGRRRLSSEPIRPPVNSRPNEKGPGQPR